ncbi:UNVERIFIED_CONTAM: hypothetical protein K2H54_051951 [Gekko kuhli]
MMDYCTSRVRCSSSCTSSSYGGATLIQTQPKRLWSAWVMERTQEHSDHWFLEEEDYDVNACIEALERGQ